MSWEKGKYLRNASQELSVPWAETPRGQWSQNPVSVPTGTLSGKSLGISLSTPTRHVPVWGGVDEVGVSGGTTGPTSSARWEVCISGGR